MRWLKSSHNRWNALLFNLMDLMGKIANSSPLAPSTIEDFELAPIYRWNIALFCLANFALHLAFLVLREPKLVWYGYCGGESVRKRCENPGDLLRSLLTPPPVRLASLISVPAFMTSEAIYFCSAPRRPGFPLSETLVFMLFPCSFTVTAVGHYVTGYWTNKIFQNAFVALGALLFFPLALKLRHELGRLEDDMLVQHIHYGVFAGMAQFMGMTFFLADGFGCLLAQHTIEEIDASCGGVVYPAFGCAANIGAMLIYRVGFGIFDQAIIKTNTTTADVMKFNITNREKVGASKRRPPSQEAFVNFVSNTSVVATASDSAKALRRSGVPILVRKFAGGAGDQHAYHPRASHHLHVGHLLHVSGLHDSALLRREASSGENKGRAAGVRNGKSSERGVLCVEGWGGGRREGL